jgi:ribosomal protein S18 acetylase RimI-like enzyme
VDLEEPFWSASTWYRSGDAVVGLVTLPDDGFTTAYAVSTRDAEGCLNLLSQLDGQIHSGMLLTGPLGLAASVATTRKIASSGPHHRYLLTDPTQLPTPDPRIRPLDPEQADLLEKLYRSEPDAVFFRRHMLDDRAFVGIFEGDDLVAAAGTHVLSDRQGLAAIGSVYTLPSLRGQGLGRAVTAGVCHRIADHIRTIGLNVAADNAPARALYSSMGFEPLLGYEELEIS